jgi:hypothetical protein
MRDRTYDESMEQTPLVLRHSDLNMRVHRRAASSSMIHKAARTTKKNIFTPRGSTFQLCEASSELSAPNAG